MMACKELSSVQLFDCHPLPLRSITVQMILTRTVARAGCSDGQTKDPLRHLPPVQAEKKCRAQGVSKPSFFPRCLQQGFNICCGPGSDL